MTVLVYVSFWVVSWIVIVQEFVADSTIETMIVSPGKTLKPTMVLAGEGNVS